MRKILAILTLLISLTVSSQTYSLTATEYHPGHNCGTITASGDHINSHKISTGVDRWVALSPDMFEKYGFKMGDIIDVQSSKCPQVNGRWIVKDKTGRRHRKHIDFLSVRSKPLKVHGQVSVTVVGHEHKHKKHKRK